VTLPEQVFCFAYARCDQGSREAVRKVYREAFSTDASNQSVAGKVQAILAREDIREQLATEDEAIKAERQAVMKAERSMNLDEVKALSRLKQKAILVAQAVLDDLLQSLADGKKISAAQAKGMETALKAAGLLKGDAVVVNSGVSDGDVAALADRLTSKLALLQIDPGQTESGEVGCA